VAGLAGVQTPLVKAFLAIGSAITQQDFAVTGRSLSSLGLGGFDRAALQALLNEGFR
jgi:opine dehydrogenase